MTNERKNELFTQHQNLINYTIKRNWPLIAALRLEAEDVSQELSIKMWNAIGSFDPERSESLPAYLTSILQYEILNIKRRHKPHGMTHVGRDERPEFVYLDEYGENGWTTDIPVYDDISVVEVAEATSNLSDIEREVIDNKIIGFPARKKQQAAVLAAVRERLEEYYYTEKRSA